MQKACKAFFAVTGRILFIGFSIQIVLGICWMVCNFTGFQKFGESALYAEISKTLICDEYEGILYPVLIMLARGIEELFLIPYRYILYLLQIGFAFFASHKLVASVGVKGRFWIAWGSLSLLTFPMAMQCHLAILPESLVCSCLLLELAFGMNILRGDRLVTAREFVKVLLCWLLAALLQPEYLVIGAVLVVLLFFYGLTKEWKSDKMRILYHGILVLAFVGMITGLEGLTQAEGYYGRVHQSLGASLVSRFAWLHAAEDYENWPQEAKEHITMQDAIEITYYADNMERMLGRTLENAVGQERAEELFLEIASHAWQNHRSEVLHSVAWDAVGYTFSPMVFQRQLTGKAYDSYSGRNYDIMSEKTPLLTKYYMDYGCWWFTVGLVITVLMQAGSIVRFAIGFVQKKICMVDLKGKLISVTSCLLTSCAMVLLYTLRGAGMMDYKKTVAVTLLWLVLMIKICVAGLVAQNGVYVEDNKEHDCESEEF